MAGTIYEDFVKAKLSEKRQRNPAIFLKSFVVIIGIITTALVYIVEHLGGLLSLNIGLNGIAQGPLLGLFTLGVLFPRANSKVSSYLKTYVQVVTFTLLFQGAFYGAIVSTICMITLVFGANYLKSIHALKAVVKPVSIEGCLNTTNLTISPFLTSTSR